MGRHTNHLTLGVHVCVNSIFLSPLLQALILNAIRPMWWKPCESDEQMHFVFSILTSFSPRGQKVSLLRRRKREVRRETDRKLSLSFRLFFFDSCARLLSNFKQREIRSWKDNVSAALFRRHFITLEHFYHRLIRRNVVYRFTP